LNFCPPVFCIDIMPMADVGKWGHCAWMAACVLIPLSLTLVGCGGTDGVTTPSPTTAGPTPPPTTVTTTTVFTFSGFACTSDLKIAPTAKMVDKGLCLDDTTFLDCPGEMPGLWPHTPDLVKHLRLFTAWKDEWGDVTKRDKAWNKLVKFVKDQNAQVFFGTMVTCDPAQDAKDWKATLALMKLVGPEHVSAVGFGNEMDVFWRGQTTPKPPRECLVELWADNGRFWNFIQTCQEEMDLAGFQNAKLTSTWAMTVLGFPGAAIPFKEDTGPAYARVNTLLTNAFKKYGQRWVWTYNIYAIWDSSLYHLDKGSSTQCTGSINAATGPYIDNYLVNCRKAMKKITGNDNDPLVVGETGWSNPCPAGLDPKMKQCPFCSRETFRKIYAHFVSWDFSVTDQAKGSTTFGKKFQGPDQAYYFTLRDSNNGGAPEYFGLMNSCSDNHCKLNLSNTPASASKHAVTVV